ncbi:hypothetical protein, partial [Dactylosporangium salmoneum]
MQTFDLLTTLLRRGDAGRAEQVRSAEPGAWLPRWTAGEPLSRALRGGHELGSLIGALHVDDAFAWALAGDVVYRITLADGAVHRQPLEGEHEYLRDATFAGHTLVAIEDERLLVWDLDGGALRLATDPDDVSRRAGALSSVAATDGVAVAGTEGGHLLQWDLTGGRLLARTLAHDGYVSRVAISTAGEPAVLSVGEPTGAPRTLRFHALDGLRPAGGAVAPDTWAAGWTVLDGRTRAVTVAFDGPLTVWDPATATPVAEFATGSRNRALAFAGDGSLAVVGAARVLRLVDLRDGALRGTIRTDFRHEVDAVAACGARVIVAQGSSTEGRTNLVELAEPLPHDAEDRPHLFGAVATTSRGRPIVVGVDASGPLRVYDAAGGREIAAAGERSARERLAGWYPRVCVAGGLVVAAERQQPSTFDPATGVVRTAEVPPFAGLHGGPVLAAVAGDDGRIALMDGGGTLAVWDAATLTTRAVKRIGEPLETLAVAFAGAAVLTGHDSGAIRWFDAEDLTELAPPGRFAARTGRPGHRPRPVHDWPSGYAVTALKTIARVLVAAAGSTVTSDDFVTGEPVGPDLAHPAWVTALCVGERGLVATGCADGSLRVWDRATGDVVREITLPRPVHHIVAVDEH